MIGALLRPFLSSTRMHLGLCLLLLPDEIFPFAQIHLLAFSQLVILF